MFDRFDDIYGCYNEPDNAETDDKYNLKIFDPKDKAALVIQVPAFCSHGHPATTNPRYLVRLPVTPRARTRALTTHARGGRACGGLSSPRCSG